MAIENPELAYRVLEHVLAFPEQHVQPVYRCKTGLCYAGWTSELTGTRWVTDDPQQEFADWVLVPDEEIPAVRAWYARNDEDGEIDLYKITESARQYAPHLAEHIGRWAMQVGKWARYKLGITWEHANILFAGENVRSALPLIVKGIESDDPDLIRQGRDLNDRLMDEPGEKTLPEWNKIVGPRIVEFR